MNRRAFALLGLLSVGCSAPAKPADTTPVAVQPATAPTTQPASPPLPAGIPHTATGRQLAWVLDIVAARHGELSAAEAESHFSPGFLAKVPVEQLVSVFKKFDGLKLRDVAAEKQALIARITIPDGEFRIIIALDDNQAIDTLFFQIDPGPKPTSFAEATALLSDLAPRTQLLVAAVDKGVCRPLYQVRSDEQMAIGSSFKLYVLLALADQILAGKIDWDRELVIRDDWKSLPSGITQDAPAGNRLSVRTLAERMISISDNTATDHLLYTLGRKQVETALRSAKHAKAALDIPFLATRELFLFKLELSDEQIEGYLRLGANERRRYLDRDLTGKQPSLLRVSSWTTPRRIEQLEWFASADDLCRVMATLATRAERPKAAPLLEVLAKNPMLPLSKSKWSYVGYKGGSEPGVMNLTWLLRRDDDKWFVVSLGFNAPAGPLLPEAKLLHFANAVIELLEHEAR